VEINPRINPMVIFRKKDGISFNLNENNIGNIKRPNLVSSVLKAIS
jgi:hypothetical protein